MVQIFNIWGVQLMWSVESGQVKYDELCINVHENPVQDLRTPTNRAWVHTTPENCAQCAQR